MSNSTETSNQSDIWATTTDLTTLRQKLLDLFCQLAYQEGDFVLSSGQQSSYYINGKQVTLHPQGALAVGRLLLQLLPKDTQAVAGLTLGADPIVSAVSVVSVYENRPIPALIIRKEAKGHGTMAYIEGPSLPQGAKVVVLEDVVTTGQSALKAVERLQAAGYTVNRVISLIDRLQGGAELYQSNGLQFDVLFSIRDLQERYQQILTKVSNH
ncbi:orotate phosphoribosyltransferase [Anabaena cylindrica FACHB-243]|uniref:Orotate phosphoribosyltransferase n=1 Tax=Anabaena cylindrica (strain ATCC 27899 / PCC 7122) TaxID=272123 RepID=K9ZAR9_ANACC|nr:MULTISPECIES: orotate phosphoribosyltransferase [Anabaena]AFZ56288.1 orotate phosphoribosyltransferase [Anabaena cylindrica PCC 7122]MBD2417519.1 orotate phosphoribosyltransferase [Anabaena cylindrica FACHB-243]MBY5285154.1 orotate phosphoribosyltransferase [Anabaena sp. CCAP 1446/1C]MBY5307386.1 orotate phosphoribosyltransferase [Anabaena sp. CCAP 1446/1C]MCM2407689.1 orotate phosphoribosyltransferase [Anabaena sp. CCAP 1446/1C]